MHRKEVLLSSRVKAASYHLALWLRTNAKRSKGPEVMGKLFHGRRFMSHGRRALLPPRRMLPLWQQSISSSGAPDIKRAERQESLLWTDVSIRRNLTSANMSKHRSWRDAGAAFRGARASLRCSPEKISCLMCAATSCCAASVSTGWSGALASRASPSPSMEIIRVCFGIAFFNTSRTWLVCSACC